MKLEDEIHQKTFKSPYQKLAINILYTSNWLNGHFADFFRNTGLTVQQYNVLRILRGQYPNYSALKLIKERMLDRMSDASRIVDKLVIKGYVIRHQCPHDRRSVNLIISESGLKILQQLDIIEDRTKEVFNSLNVEQVEKLNHLLDELRG